MQKLAKIILLSASLSVSIFSNANAQPTTYKLDAGHSFVHFESIHHGTSTNRGRFDDVTGTVLLDKQANKGSVDVDININSVNTGDTDYNAHLLNADFFDAKRFSKAQFKSDHFTYKGGRVEKVEGFLTLLGKTAPVTLTAIRFNCYNSRHFENREVCGGDFETTLQRSAFGMNFALPNILDNVKILIQIEAVSEK